MIGEVIHNYKIEKLLGQGGMGLVYLATHQQLGRRVAIKSLHAHLATNPDIRARFVKEATTLAHLKHNHIVMLYDYFETAQALYLIMEYVEGQELGEHIEQVSGPITAERTLYIFKQLLDAFGYAHSQNIVHRDIKPSNILFASHDTVKVLDFGIARMLGSEHSGGLGLTRTGMRMGTALYMSPEQVKGLVADARSDIYALGMVLFEMLTGSGVYKSETSEFDVHVKIVNEPLPRAKSIYPGVADWLQIVIDKATAKNPLNRYQNCQEFASALLAGPNNRAEAAPSSVLVEPKKVVVPPPVLIPPSPPPYIPQKPLENQPNSSQKSGRSSALLITVSLIIVFVLVVVGLMIKSSKPINQADSPLEGGRSSGDAITENPNIPDADAINREKQRQEEILEQERSRRQAEILAIQQAKRDKEKVNEETQRELLINALEKTEALPPCDYEIQLGLCEGEITLKNNSEYTIDQVTVQLLSENDPDNMWTFEVTFENIEPGGKRVSTGISSVSGGSHFTSKIISIQCKELEANFQY